MKIYTVTLKKDDMFKITYCDYRPNENETFVVNGERWEVWTWI